MLHSNPGDYAWGQGGLDAVITQVCEAQQRFTPGINGKVEKKLTSVCVLQLLGQLENTGPPPAEKEKISSLPTVNISQEQAGQ